MVKRWMALGMVAAGLGMAQGNISGEITVWSWDIAAKALQATVPSFNKLYPNVKVNVVDLGNQQVYDKGLSGCAAGGTDLPDVYSVENNEAEVFWARFPNCFTDLNTLAPSANAFKGNFPAFKWTELQVGNKTYAMPWDSGPVVMFYRRDLYQKAGVNPDSIETWDDYIAAGKKIVAATGAKVGVIANGTDDEWFRMLANQNGCFYFSNDAKSVTVNKPGCVSALETVKKLIDAGVVMQGGWNEQIQAFKAGKVATAMFGGWYEGTIRSNAPELEGKWGVFRMPAAKKGGVRAANLGGSALALPASSKNKAAAWAFIRHALATTEGQVTMLKEYGLVPSYLPALKDPYVNAASKYWGGQAIWKTILGTLGDVPQARGTQYFQEARQIMIKVQADYVSGRFKSAKEALDSAAKQISSATGLPIAK
ncbi:ABC transporter substrate-binding protein [Calidithermus timidus]|jgi:lactose/L-arabinose transport system substrate-binding protein|uniref:ABC transporter substrate-binding protein n=1 Tax=Calidithermus timidus TaxID=307124 RepID=UPI00039EB5BD|nr:sugar ABC transporter substrate-binding protein [Calidithermus timidus]